MLKPFALLLCLLPGLAWGQTAHGIAMHGDLKYQANFSHFDWVNPNAPKGGELRQADIGTFDSFNPFISKGQTPDGIELLYDHLMAASEDEPFSMYALIAESVETPPDRSWVVFRLNPKARWHDGKPITADDVIFTFQILTSKGAPTYRMYYAGVDKVEKVGDRGVKFTFKPGDNRELPLVLGEMPVLPKHYWQNRTFEETSLEPPLGSGPYKIGTFEPGRFVRYERVADYWGRDLPVRRGLYNFDRLRFDMYRDATVAVEALKAGEYDLRQEKSAKNWATSYTDWKAIAEGKARLERIPHGKPAGMQAFAFNTRRPIFGDIRVREALALAFDFEWANKTLFYDQYRRTESFFANSELAAIGLPQADELAHLTPLRGQIPDRVFTQEFHASKTDGSGDNRPNLRQSMALLEQAGWDVVDGKLIKDGQPFVFEILLAQANFERIVLPFARKLARLGIEARVRTVDTSQYLNRVRAYDFDMIVQSWGQSFSPGNEQAYFWSSQAADQPGSHNMPGIKDKAVDQLVDLVISAPDRPQLVARTRALDRVLLWNHFVIPQWHLSADRLAYWDRFGKPDRIPMKGWQWAAWWSKEIKAP